MAVLIPLTGLMAAAAPARQVAGFPASASLTLLSFNVMANDLDVRVDDLAAYIADLRPDIACLQEMHRVENFERMRRRLAELGWPMEARQAIGYMGVFSRYPIRDYQELPDGHERRIQTFVVDYPVRDGFRAYQVHPVPGHGCTVVATLLALTEQHREARFLLGDFNLTPETDCLLPLLAGHIRACTVAQNPACANTVNRPVWCHYNPSYCQPGQVFPDAAIDHILFQSHTPWQLFEAWCDHQMTLSDHFPVIARFVYDARLAPAPSLEAE